jgi:hypothetical protein
VVGVDPGTTVPTNPDDSTLKITAGAFEGDADTTTPAIGFTTGGYPDGTAQVYYAAVSSGASAPTTLGGYGGFAGRFGPGTHTGQTITLNTADDEVYLIAVKDETVSAPLLISRLDESLIVKDGALSWNQPDLPRRNIRFTTDGYSGDAAVYYAMVSAGDGAPPLSAYTGSLGAFSAGNHVDKELTLPAMEVYDVYLALRRNGKVSAPIKIHTESKGRFVGGSNTSIGWSDDGETWIKGTGVSSGGAYTRVNDIAYGNGIWVAVLGSTGNGTLPSTRGNKALWSDDGGETWNQATLPRNVSMDHVVYGGGKFVALPLLDGTYVYYSTNGKDWSTAEMPKEMYNMRWDDIVFGNGLFVAVPNYRENPNYYYIDPEAYSMDVELVQKIAYSTNGTTWKTSAPPRDFGTYYGGKIAYGDGGFLLNYGSSSSRYSYWSDGTIGGSGMTWTSLGSKSMSVGGGGLLRFSMGRFILIGSSKTYISTNKGADWNPITLPGNFSGVTSAYGETPNGTGRLMITGANGRGIWSDDRGATWTAFSSGDINLYNITYVSRP